MTDTPLSRREAAGLAVAGAAFAALAALPGEAEAAQPNMQRALRALENARDALQAARSNKGGHRVEALRLVNAAIREVRRGINVAS